ncbi:helix-turn-helix domain-containing protein [Candidatus Woesearchaeota archaeon]|jgi:hypothetical protein|nr:helix-turn-helix domain-containing protein [Candidatus Woesearchaeota archaeon]MBT3537718.1 helix-turn-helix domain-containing protein [Candidatus Woesearchaeota archaeon]MBT4697849.1 helix-turn-helix domain-containing protein [Candidatus Woesearchaeota archaeon]MBT4717491.1 helix-turn-helix domain-containing protein [Candidatus Woesearchaeota archaeon]MBT7105387.1 helix-turn-helix domain-containing protein [Candidatus Woesearchaeota archaeon]
MLDSPEQRISKKIYEYFEKKYSLGFVGLIKAACLASLRVKNRSYIPVSNITIAPSGQFKSRISIEVMLIFQPSTFVDLGSDFTMHSLMEKFRGGKLCNNKTLMINDLTLLFSTKKKQTKDRLVNGLAEVLSEGKYVYSERNSPSIVFKSRINVIANITRESYLRNRTSFLDNTFGERLVPIFYHIPEDKQIELIRTSAERKSMDFGDKIKLDRLEISNFNDFSEEIIKLSRSYKNLALSPSLSRSQDKMMGLLGGLCILNNRGRVIESDIKLVTEFLKYFCDPHNTEFKVMSRYFQGKSVKEIKQEIGTSDTYIYRIISKYKDRGVV